MGIAIQLMVSMVCAAQTRYRTAELLRLAEACGVQDSSRHDDPTSKNIIITYEKDSVVTHIGYLLFSEEMKQVAKSPVLPFLERYFLQLHYPPNGKTADIMIQEDQFVFEKGSLKTLEQLRDSDTFNYSYELRRYRAAWSREGKEILAVSFPKQYELLAGVNKIEAESLLEGDIKSTKIPIPEKEALFPFKKNDLQAVPALSDTYIFHGNRYLNKQINSNLYLKERKGHLSLVVDVAHPAESAANILLCRHAPGEYTMRFDQTLYGYKRKHFEVPLIQWLQFCRENGCELYCGIEEVTNSKTEKNDVGMAVTASVFAVNQAEGYTHVLYVEVPFSVIDNQKGTVTARLDSYVPMHNVAGLFGKERKTKNKSTKIYEK